MINNPRVMGEHVNGPVRNVVAWTFSGVLVCLSVLLLLSPFVS
jgi:Mn2+/Fe2+ NRAMP family transporter